MAENTKTLLAVGGIAIAGYGVYKLLQKPPSEELASIYGTVVDSETLQPVPGINIRLGDVNVAATNSNGEFLVENIEPGTYSLSFIDPLGQYQTYTY